MKIALDFDGTFTADPSFWLDFISKAEKEGHEVRIVTMRCEIKDGINWAHMGWAPPCAVMWCDGEPKRDFCKAAGWVPDIWIDDDPYSLVNGSKWRHNDPNLVEWRKTDEYRNPANGREGTQGAADLHGRPRLLSRRARSGGGGQPEGERSAQPGPATSLGEGEVN